MAETRRPGRNPRQGITAKALKLRKGKPVARPRGWKAGSPPKPGPKA